MTPVQWGRRWPLHRCWNAELGARELVHAYREVGMTQADFDGDRYIRLRRLRTLLEDGSLAADLRWLRAAA